MRLEGDPRSNIVGVAFHIRGVGPRITSNKLIANLETAQVRKIRRRPERVAERIAVIASLVVIRAQDTMVVEFLAGIILVDILAAALELINRVLHGPDPPRERMLSKADGIPQAPADEISIEKLFCLTAEVDFCDVVAANLRMPTPLVAGVGVYVGIAAPGDEKCARLLFGYEQRASGMVGIAHVGDESEVGGEIDGDGFAVVLEGKDARGRGDVDEFSIV